MSEERNAVGAMDQKMVEAWDILYSQGDDWTAALDELIQTMAERRVHPVTTTIALLANIGLMHMMASRVPG